MVRHYALMYGIHTLPNVLKNLSKPRASLLEVFQHIQERMEAIH